MKLFSVKSSVNRAAKAAGLTKEMYEIVEVDGKFGYQVLPAIIEEIKELKEGFEQSTIIVEDEEVEGDYLEGCIVLDNTHCCPNCMIDLRNGYAITGSEVNGVVQDFNEFQYMCLACGSEFGPAIVKTAPKQEAKTEVVIKTVSDIERPTKAVWHIADELSQANPSVRRKDVIAECVNRGVAYNTARTQYQQWLTATRACSK